MIKFTDYEGFALKCTQELWNRYISYVLNAAYSTRVINSEQLHTLSAQFDPTQKVIDGETFGIETVLQESKEGWD